MHGTMKTTDKQFTRPRAQMELPLGNRMGAACGSRSNRNNPRRKPARRGRLVVRPHAHGAGLDRVTAGGEERGEAGMQKRPRIMLDTRRVVAMFGRAKLMREQDGRYQLEGGSHRRGGSDRVGVDVHARGSPSATPADDPLTSGAEFRCMSAP